MSPSTRPNTDAPPHRTRWPLWVAGVVLAVVAIRAALPSVLTSVLADQVGRALGAQAQVDDVDLAILAGDITLVGVALSPRSGGPPGLRCQRVRGNLSWFALLRGQLRVELLELDGLELQIRRDADGSMRIPGVVEPSPTEVAPAEGGSDDDGSPLAVHLDRVELRDLRLDYREQDPPLALGFSIAVLALGPVAVQVGDALAWSVSDAELSGGGLSFVRGDESPVDIGLVLRANGLGSGPDAAGQVRIELRSGEGEIRITGPVAPVLPLTGIELAWEKLDLGGLMPLVPPALGLEVRGGTSSGKLNLDISARDAQEDTGDAGVASEAGLTARGWFEVVGLDSELAAPRSIAAAWKKLRVEIEEVWVPLAAPEPPSIQLASLVLEEPDLRLVRATDGEPPAVEEDGQSQTPPGSPPGSAPSLVLAELVVERGRLRLEDRSFAPPLETSLSEIAIAAAGLRWPEGAVSDLRLSIGSLGKEGPLTLTGSVEGEHTSAEICASKVSLLHVAHYVRQNSSYAIRSGQVSITSDIEVDGAEFRAPTRVVLHDLLVDDEDAEGGFAEQFGVSLDVALMMLRDPVKGDITLDLPIKGTTDAGRVALARVFADSLRRVLINSVATPLKLAGMLIPDADRSHAFRAPSIVFEAGGAEPKVASDRDPTPLAELLTKHPELAVRIEAVVVKADLKVLEEAGDLMRVDGDALSSAALQVLGELAENRLSRVRERLERLLGGFSGRIVEVPWEGKLGHGKPRVVGYVTLAPQAR